AVGVWALAVAMVWMSAAGAATKRLVVEAGKPARAHVPMSVDVPAGTTQAKMTDEATGKEVACQVADGKLHWVLDALDAGASKTYAVELGAAPGVGAGVSFAVGAGKVDIAIEGKPFTTYVHKLEKIGNNQLRRPYFYPVYGPGQLPMTRAYPMAPEKMPKGVRLDHPHHTSIWVAHGSVNGVDNWSISPKAGWQLHTGWKGMTSGPAFGQFVETLDWVTADKKPVMAETRTVRVWRQPDAARMLDLTVALEAKYGDVKLGDTKEGGLCATRMRPEFRHDRKGLLVNDSGQKGGAAWGKKSAWTSASGTVDGKQYGYAIFDHPTNLRHPTTWHARTYGLLTANAFGLAHFTRKKEQGDCTIKKGETLTFRYRIYFHRGGPEEAKVAARHADFATPPAASWK
ncbi:PmoA family protein, partial [bacterium]|nr:PmoA family protein [bacterium]